MEKLKLLNLENADPKLIIEIQRGVCDDHIPEVNKFRKWAMAAMEVSMVITIRIVGSEEISKLNYQFANKKKATNILAFPYTDTSPLSGDIAICLPVAIAEANKQRKTLNAHLAHLTIHGVLHLQGYDHITKKDAKQMEHLESNIMSKLGFADPYIQTC